MAADEQAPGRRPAARPGRRNTRRQGCRIGRQMSATTQPTPPPAEKPTAKPVRRVTLADIAKMHAEKQRIAMLTAYDYPTARVIDDAGVPLILVGDSVGMVMLGYEETVRVSME